MLNHPSLDNLRVMKLDGMAQAFAEQLELNTMHDLSFEERFALLIDRELNYRDNKRFDRRMKVAKLRQAASLEDVDYRHPRNLERNLMQSLSTLAWLKDKRNLLISGPTGVGKTYLACAFAQQACRKDFSAYYAQTHKLLAELLMAKADGRYFSLLNKFAKFDLLILDDWGLDDPTEHEKRILLDLLDERYQRRSTLIASQFHPNLWHENLASPTLADAILDRLLHNAYRLDLKGDSLRKTKHALTQTPVSGS